jgi:hypothetical protein
MSILLHARSMAQAALTSARSSRLGHLMVAGLLLLALALAARGTASPAAAPLTSVAHQTQVTTSASHIVPGDPCGGVLAGC